MSRKGTYPGGSAGLTITDTATRNNIALGKVSSTYISTVDNQIHHRGVVQLDAVTGGDLSYLRGTGNPDDLAYMNYYSSPNNSSVSSHTNAPGAGTMTVPTGQKVSHVASRVKSKIGTLGLLAALFIGFFLLERR